MAGVKCVCRQGVYCAFHVTLMQARREGFKAKGLCYRCGRTKEQTDKACCNKHLEQAAAYQRKLKDDSKRKARNAIGRAIPVRRPTEQSINRSSSSD